MGATVMLSPVWMPIGSRFSMEQMMTQLSALSHDFHLEFLPAEQGFLDENFRHGRKLEAALGDFLELLAVVSDAAARATEREAGPNDERVTANLFRDGAGFVQRVGRAADGNVEADAQHQVLEHLAVFTAFDGGGVCADQFDAVLLQDAGVV